MKPMTKTRSNEEWLDQLAAEGAVQAQAITDLRDLLLRAALFFFNRNPGDLERLDRQEILQRAEDCAQDALMAIMAQLGEFRGDSKFTTWAYKFAINKALMAARRERWKDISLDDLESDGTGEFLDDLVADQNEIGAPEQSTLRREVRTTIQEVIETELTEKQRRALVLMVFHGVPLDEVVRHLGSNRNAVYKLLHDARRKLKSRLQERGFETGEALKLFSPQG
jgi:RNA polymerase sigma-70 factor (ECF subfamily)